VLVKHKTSRVIVLGDLIIGYRIVSYQAYYVLDQQGVTTFRIERRSYFHSVVARGGSLDSRLGSGHCGLITCEHVTGAQSHPDQTV